MKREGIEYETVDLTADKAAFEAVQQLGYLKAPVVKVESSFGEQSHWAGFRPDKIKALAASHELIPA